MADTTNESSPALGTLSSVGTSTDVLLGESKPAAAATASRTASSAAASSAAASDAASQPHVGELATLTHPPREPNKRLTALTEWVYQERRLAKDANGLGLDVLPTPDGLVVTGIVAGGAAEAAGSWHVDDVIVSVDGTVTINKDPAAAVNLLRTVAGEARLGVLSHAYNPDAGVYQPGTPQVFTEYYFDDGIITKDADGFGMDIAVPDEEGVLVTFVVPGGAADRAGFIRAGDRIVRITDKSVVGLSRTEVVEWLRDLEGDVKFSILAVNQMHPRHRRLAPIDSTGSSDSSAGSDRCTVM